MSLEDFLRLASNWAGLVALALFAFAFGPAVIKCGAMMGWW